MKVGTRGSRLALKQTEDIIAKLSRIIPDRIEKVIVKTSGDKIKDSQLYKIDRKGIFTKELDNAVLEERVDFAVHSLKDVPTEIDEDLTIAAVPEREPPHEVLVSRLDWDELPANSRIGTSSLRREAFCKHYKKEFKLEPLRGNIDTRIRKVMEGEIDATIMAEAGLKRLGLEENIKRRFPLKYITPAAGQGALAVITRKDNPKLDLIKKLNHYRSLQEVKAEKSVLKGLGVGCQWPLGVIAQARNKKLYLYAILLSREGDILSQVTLEGPINKAQELGERAANEMEDYL
ncbi:hydroxymethylbilane synthase [Methanothermobacter tenebrarum]|uniref:Probable porphobilinogen deaminase n=1 Tax=Methanothermobacter tenebrarum TaxID=680118 RepID=A0A328PC96_9EURY|nr:hydroxymethylbilane synthase [Methanothermobacter tenebrarum]MBC7100142.1 hydroxymethylbilane synthase [Methanobacteriales archaeon]NPV64931.1 hydroxymethylbilane synthase [Methanobacteriaceae archaeon]RAO79380.1 hydroxymethylbilane synthase [Methanothermobacter tenebrarum]